MASTRNVVIARRRRPAATKRWEASRARHTPAIEYVRRASLLRVAVVEVVIERSWRGQWPRRDAASCLIEA